MPEYEVLQTSELLLDPGLNNQTVADTKRSKQFIPGQKLQKLAVRKNSNDNAHSITLQPIK